MKHNLDRVVLCVVLISFAPVIANCISKDAAILVESRRSDATTDIGVTLETVLSVLVPEVESPVGAGSAKGAVDRVKRDVVDRINICDVIRGGVSVALEGEVGAIGNGQCTVTKGGKACAKRLKTYLESLSSTYWMAQRPSILPMAKPAESVKQLTTRVCHLRGLCSVL